MIYFLECRTSTGRFQVCKFQFPIIIHSFHASEVRTWSLWNGYQLTSLAWEWNHQPWLNPDEHTRAHTKVGKKSLLPRNIAKCGCDDALVPFSAIGTLLHSGSSEKNTFENGAISNIALFNQGGSIFNWEIMIDQILDCWVPQIETI